MNDPAISLTSGGLGSLESVMAVMEESFDPAFGEAWTSSQCAGLLPMPGVWLTLARCGNEVAGFALSREVAGEAELLLLAVRRRNQSQGIGEMLVRDFMKQSRERGAARLHLEVREGNHAVKLYERAGFALVGRRRHYYTGRDGSLHDALTLAMKA